MPPGSALPTATLPPRAAFPNIPEYMILGKRRVWIVAVVEGRCGALECAGGVRQERRGAREP
jgi:hypothetical protein